MADAVAGEGDVCVRLVLPKGQGVLLDIFVDARPRNTEERAQQPFLRGEDVKPLQRRAAGKAEKHSLCIIVAVMGGEHGVRAPVEHLPIAFAAKEAPLLFEVAPALLGSCGHIRAEHGERHPPCLAELFHKGGVRLCRRADAVAAGERRKRNVRFLRVFMKIMKKGDGISAARNGDRQGKSPIGREGKELHEKSIA